MTVGLATIHPVVRSTRIIGRAKINFTGRAWNFCLCLTVNLIEDTRQPEPMQAFRTLGSGKVRKPGDGTIPRGAKRQMLWPLALSL